MLVLINLETASERRAAMARQLEREGLPYLRIGVDLRGVSGNHVASAVRSRFPRISFDGDALSGAEIGCWLSHLCAWQALLETPDAGTCVVIEDDVRLFDGFAAAIRQIAAPEPFELVYLGTSSRNISHRRRRRIGSACIHEPVGLILNTWGYVVSRAYAARFFEAGDLHIRIPIDHFLGGRGGALQPRIGVLRPAALGEDPALGAQSQIGPYTKRLDRAVWLDRMRRRILASRISSLYDSVYRYL